MYPDCMHTVAVEDPGGASSAWVWWRGCGRLHTGDNMAGDYLHLLTLDNAYVVIGSSAASHGLLSFVGCSMAECNMFQRRNVYTQVWVTHLNNNINSYTLALFGSNTVQKIGLESYLSILGGL